jgi:FlaG/FlaF family flagellin (archaellin)
MVAVSIVLAAMVGSVLLNIVGSVDESPLAGAQVEFDHEADEIQVVYTATQQKGTTIDVNVLDVDDVELCSQTIPEVGDDATFTAGNCPGVSDGGEYSVRVVASAPDGTQAVVLQQDGSL